MNDPFLNFKKSMKKNVFKDLSFTDERKARVNEAIESKRSSSTLHSFKEDTILAILKSLQLEAKHGFEISTQLFQKEEQSFLHNEGQLYTLLHLLENKEVLGSMWREDKKYYALTAKGRKYLAAASRKGYAKQPFLLKDLLEEAAL
ncbi:PadR family transcriptional regulator [Sutcliffiella horikoshii]|uniref:PadR family transcriptional regulator n=1 Tax=Sutcliffiella horikoshii TaxID=79883 RepID=A0A5D4TCM2_9BACI|nr:PadR family transcriptional regulator [Sutcliffiella horikoshii]TYS71804.1 PadR family transcriptional regulator [Sutcliffiella horikoshii]